MANPAMARRTKSTMMIIAMVMLRCTILASKDPKGQERVGGVFERPQLNCRSEAKQSCASGMFQEFGNSSGRLSSVVQFEVTLSSVLAAVRDNTALSPLLPGMWKSSKM
ncbi:hypothetical protein N7494_012234 [Penicillium frequentans]|uniref:Secreted protein n=1 Tax=Penicillium frequentans TaxID=3151616 RepID=A0AAD6CNV0_9EURO|nr:hypothetical protein N7494_012234 [Penicillium glabrum]